MSSSQYESSEDGKADWPPRASEWMEVCSRAFKEGDSFGVLLALIILAWYMYRGLEFLVIAAVAVGAVVLVVIGIGTLGEIVLGNFRQIALGAAAILSFGLLSAGVGYIAVHQGWDRPLEVENAPTEAE